MPAGGCRKREAKCGKHNCNVIAEFNATCILTKVYDMHVTVLSPVVVQARPVAMAVQNGAFPPVTFSVTHIPATLLPELHMSANTDCNIANFSGHWNAMPYST